MTPPSRQDQALAPVLRELYGRSSLGMRLDLGPMRAACTELGHPERAFRSVHIAGTNGKGSVAAMVESIARTSGMRVGLYTSPHLQRFAERIRLNGEPIVDEALVTYLTRALRAPSDKLSFFEVATLAAFLAFADRAVDLAVIEVGIGGRLDATNVIPHPSVTAITRVALDHTDRLGATLQEIAREKAGIAKPSAPLVVGPISEVPMGVVREICEARGVRIVDATLPLSHDALGRAPDLLGAHQLHNGRIAWEIGQELGLEHAACREGIVTARWPGRGERIDVDEHSYLLDGAHNPDGALALAALLTALGTEDPVLVFGALEDKDWQPMQDILVPSCRQRVYVPPKGRLAADPHALAARAPGVVCADVEEGLARARSLAGPRRLIVVAGSLYLVGEARAQLLKLPVDPAIAL